ncbi:DUF3099 domain-containing protein [Sinomonas sp. G460-2]|uniref:DUF3099 domain-containing protein n=1 Tax=Sinomonas sp. G460-2 TaxID=3393464 RepID=UPI0039EFA0E8
MERLTNGADQEPEEDRTSEDPEVHSITTAAPGHSEDMHKRMVRYATAMGIRMVCIILLFVVDGWFKLLAAIGAVFLPWVAVVIANAQTKADSESDSLIDAPPVAELEGGLAASGDGEVLPGEIVDNADDDDAASAVSGDDAGRASRDEGSDADEQQGTRREQDNEKRSA